MDLFDAMDRDDAKKQGAPSMAIDDSLQTNEPLLQRESDNSLNNSSSSLDSQYSDLPKQARDSEEGREDSRSQQQQGDSSSTLSNLSNKLGLSGERSSHSEWSDLPKELRSPAGGSGVTATSNRDQGNSSDLNQVLDRERPSQGDKSPVPQDLGSTNVTDDLPTSSIERSSVKVGDTPAPHTASIAPMHSVNEEEGTTTVAGSTLWPFTHTVKKASIVTEPKDPSASQPSALVSAFTAAHGKLDDAVQVVRDAVDNLAEKHLRYDAEQADHQKKEMTAADIPTLVNTQDEANAEIIKARMHPSHERDMAHHPEGKRNIYS